MNHSNRRIPNWARERRYLKPWKDDIRLSTWICDFFLPDAGSLMGILTVSCSLETTIERNEEYCVWMTLSSTDQKRWNWSVFSYLDIFNALEKSSHVKVPFRCVFHFIIGHISDDMIDEIQFHFRTRTLNYVFLHWIRISRCTYSFSSSWSLFFNGCSW